MTFSRAEEDILMRDELYPFLRSMEPIPDRVEHALSRGIIQGASFPLSVLADKLAQGSEPVEDGVLRNADGTVTVCCRTEMHRVEPEWWPWYLMWHSSRSDRYRLWHPRDHVYTEVVSSPEGEHRILIDEFIGDRLYRLMARPLAPDAVGADAGRLKAAGIKDMRVAHAAFRDASAGFCTIVHQIYATKTGCEMRSRFFVAGDIDENLIQARYDVTNPASPPKTASERIGLLLLRHCAEEMNHLAGILPELHDAFAEKRSATKG